MIGSIVLPKTKDQLLNELRRSKIKKVLVLNDVTKTDVSDKTSSIANFIGRSVGTIIVVKDDV